MWWQPEVRLWEQNAALKKTETIAHEGAAALSSCGTGASSVAGSGGDCGEGVCVSSRSLETAAGMEWDCRMPAVAARATLVSTTTTSCVRTMHRWSSGRNLRGCPSQNCTSHAFPHEAPRLNHRHQWHETSFRACQPCGAFHSGGTLHLIVGLILVNMVDASRHRSISTKTSASGALRIVIQWQCDNADSQEQFKSRGGLQRGNPQSLMTSTCAKIQPTSGTNYYQSAKPLVPSRRCQNWSK